MPVYKDEAILLRKYEFGENSEIFHLLTLSHGKVKALSKNGPSGKSNIPACFEPSDMAVVLLSEGRNFEFLIQAECARANYEIRNNLEKLALGFYILEIFDKLIPFDCPDESVFLLLKSYLEKLAVEEKVCLLTVSAMRGLLKTLGICPDFGNSNEEYDGQKEFNSFFGTCIDKFTGMNFDADFMFALKESLALPFALLKKRNYSEEIYKRILNVLEEYICYQTGEKINSSCLVKKL